MDARGTFTMIHEITGRRQGQYKDVIPGIGQHVVRDAGRADELLFHASATTLNGWRATELWRYSAESYAAVDDVGERIENELGAKVAIYPADFVYPSSMR